MGPAIRIHSPRPPPPPQRHHGPRELHEPEEPCALQETVHGVHHSGESKAEYGPAPELLYGVEYQAEADREKAEGVEGVHSTKVAPHLPELGDPTRSRTWIKSLGNSYSIH